MSVPRPPRTGRGCDHEPIHDPHRGGEDPDRRACLRHLLPAALGADRLSRHRDRRRGRQRGDGPTPPSRVGQSRPRDRSLHQLPRRLVQRPDRDLRHDALHPAGRRHRLHGTSVVRGGGAARGGCTGQAIRPATREGAAAPAVESGSGNLARPGHPGQGGEQGPGRDGGDPQPPHPGTRWPRSGTTPTGTRRSTRAKPSTTAWRTRSSPAARHRSSAPAAGDHAASRHWTSPARRTGDEARR